jgi:sulfur carrier protein
LRVTVNGEQKDVAATRIDALLGELEFAGRHFAIAVNYDVVPRGRWAETVLAEGDTVEILTPRQGG